MTPARLATTAGLITATTLATYLAATTLGPAAYNLGTITGATAVLLGTCGIAYWITGRIAETLHTARQAADHALRAAHDANRAATTLHNWWAAHLEHNDQENEDPATNPTGIPTVPQHIAAGRITDTDLAHNLAQLEQIVRANRTHTTGRHAK